jgi:hypothetical protein
MVDVKTSSKKTNACSSIIDSDIELNDDEKDVIKNIYVPLLKINNEERLVTGVVLQPEVADAQGDIMDAVVIRKAAHKFLMKYNKVTELGLQHKYFGNTGFELCESWTTPQDVVINGTVVKMGSWIMTVYVENNKAWALVKNGKLTGFSVGGRAKAKKIDEAHGQ